MMQQAAEMMKNMSPETMEAMMSVAADMQGGGMGPDGMPTADTMKKMQEKMGDPKMQKAVRDDEERKPGANQANEYCGRDAYERQTGGTSRAAAQERETGDYGKVYESCRVWNEILRTI